jgi:hypothetical protein
MKSGHCRTDQATKEYYEQDNWERKNNDIPIGY